MSSLVVGPTTVQRLPWKLGLQLTGIAALVTLLLIRFFLAEIVRVRGNSMAPALTEGDLVLIRHGSEAGRGDIVLLELEGRVALRRVIGIPGDVIGGASGVLTLNELPISTQLSGTFAYLEPRARGPATHRQQLLHEELEPGRFIRVLGDHVGSGRPWRLEVATSTVEPDQLFVLCDNRRECPGEGLAGSVPASAVVGRAQSVVLFGDARIVAPAPAQGRNAPLTAGPLPPSEPGSASGSGSGVPLK